VAQKKAASPSHHRHNRKQAPSKSQDNTCANASDTSLPPPPLRAHVRMYFIVEPRFRPPGGPFVLDGQSQLRPDASSGMKIYVAKLLILLNPVSIHLFQLIVQLIALHETITTGFTAEAKHSPKIFGKLSESVQGKLVELYLELQ
jgi:hypothetical protein